MFPDGSFSRAPDTERPREIVQKYTPGEKTTAYVVPGFPESSYLRTKQPDLASLVLGFFGALLAAGGLGGIRQGLTGEEPPGPAY